MPKGCDAYGSGSVCVTASDAPSITLKLAASLLVTQTEPFGATASVRGPAPTAISPSFALVAALNTDTELLSWLTTQTRPPPFASNTMLLELVGLLAVSGGCTTC